MAKQKQIRRQKKEIIKFKARDGARFGDKQAEEFGKRILELMEQNGKRTINQITAQEVLDDARNSHTPYHNYFDWDDSTAAEEYRLQQARQIISSIVQVRIINDEKKPVRVFVNVITPSGERAYMATEQVIKNPKLVQQIVADALHEAKTWRDKYISLLELSKISGAITETLEEYNDL